jgi:hypothetical protein
MHQGTVDYRAFCHTVVDIFTNQELESQPKAEPLDVGRLVARTTGSLILDLTPDLKLLFAKMAHQVRTHGVHVHESYMDFDTHNNGRVSCSQFLRNLPFVDMAPRELQLLLQRYMDPIARDVNYRRLHIELQHRTGDRQGSEVMPDTPTSHAVD